ncbi:hypothetical protein OsccyDRAFT_4109 [Leptolyngbyaceae cyanobacterium JSC-12]|nr:hypothetical protein OsccyDRAFT_4109 [Leptolyngbyaceae cyanobacterium JSC-12]
MITAPVRQATLPKIRRHTDSPVLWIAVLTGSLLLNGVSVLGFQRTLQQIQPAYSTFAPISVSFVSKSSSHNSRSITARPYQTSVKNPPASIRPASSATAPVTSSSVKPSSLQSDGIAYRSALSSRTRSRPTSYIASESASAANSRQPPQDSVSDANAPQNEVDTVQANASTRPESPASTSSTGVSDEVATSGVLLPNVPNVPDPTTSAPKTTADQPMDSLILSQHAVPAQFLAEMKIVAGSGDRSTLAEPQALAKTLTSRSSECLLLPEALRKFNQPVVLNVSLDERGRFSEATPIRVQISSGSDSYDTLAICALQSWQAIPVAAIANAGHRVPARLKVQITLKVVRSTN